LRTLGDTVGLNALGSELPSGHDQESWPVGRPLRVLWLGGQEFTLKPLLTGLTTTHGMPVVTLVRDIESARGHLRRQAADLLVITFSEKDSSDFLGLTSDPGTPPIVLIKAGRMAGVDFDSSQCGVHEVIVEEKVTPESLRQLAGRALTRRRFLDTLSEEQRHLEDLVHRDALTGLHNRRSFESRLQVEFARASRFSEALTLVLIDVDHFKEVNDRHGHLTGDQVLVQTGRLLEGAVRSIDLVARIGGEEFALLLPNTGGAGATGLVQRIIERVRHYPFGPEGSALRVTLSAGLATCPNRACASERTLFESADSALYSAKRNGRDRLEVYSAD
jgi:diguanylate cyclase (GGDEF)-like protein